MEYDGDGFTMEGSDSLSPEEQKRLIHEMKGLALSRDRESIGTFDGRVWTWRPVNPAPDEPWRFTINYRGSDGRPLIHVMGENRG